MKFNVIVDSRQVQTQERQLITQLETAISNFLNQTEWTDDKFQEFERIKCSILITLNQNTEVSQGLYAGTIQVQSTRPAFGTDYESPMVTFFDRNFSFEYQPSQPIIFTENLNTPNLTATLAYYVYLLLALDYDSFAAQSGTPFFQKILNIMNNSQQANYAGWQQGDSRNRYWIGENLISPQFTPFREAVYLYHRQGIDQMASNPAEARKKIAEAIKKIGQVNQVRPISVLVNAFFDAKLNEILNVFSEGDPQLIKEVVQVLVKVDGTNASKYNTLVKWES